MAVIANVWPMNTCVLAGCDVKTGGIPLVNPSDRRNKAWIWASLSALVNTATSSMDPSNVLPLF